MTTELTTCRDGDGGTIRRRTCPTTRNCPNGFGGVTTIPFTNACPTMKSCPDGDGGTTMTPIADACPTMKDCPDGFGGTTMTPIADACPTMKDCPDGFGGTTMTPLADACPTMKDCPDGFGGTTMTPLADTCPTMKSCPDGFGGTTMVLIANDCPTMKTCPNGDMIDLGGRCPMRQCPGSTILVPEQSTIEDTADLCEMRTGIRTFGCSGMMPRLVLDEVECSNINTNPIADCGGGVDPDPATGMCPPPVACPEGEVRNQGGVCEREITSCPNPGDVIINNTCQMVCPTGDIVASGAQCPTGAINNPTPFQRRCTPFGSVSDDDDYELRTNCPLTLTNIQGVPKDTNGDDIYTGAGVWVGIIDGRLDTGHIEFQGHPGTFRVDNAPSVEFTEDGQIYTVAVSKPDTSQHGNNVTGILAAKKDDGVRSFNMRGVAYGSNIMFLGTGDSILISGPATRPPTLNSVEELTNAFAGELLKRFISAGAKVVARSTLFFPEGVRPPEDAQCPPPSGPNPCAVVDTANFYLRANAPQGTPASNIMETNGVFRLAESMIPPTTQREDNIAYGNHPIFVNAAGNDGLPNPDVSFGLTHQYERLRDHFVTVVAVTPDGGIASFSNRCGVVALWCIAAPGMALIVPTFGAEADLRGWIGENQDGYRIVNGTSFAAPIVAGALALLFEAFGDQMGSHEILDRLYLNANKLGIYADSAIYGQGLLDIAAALAPTGSTTLRASFGRAGVHLRDAARFDVPTSRIFLSHAFGNALSRALGGREAVFFDELDTAFAFPARTLFHTNPVHDPFRHLRTARQADVATFSGRHATLVMSLGYDAPVAAALDGYFSLVRDGPSLSLRMDVSETQHLRASVFTGRGRETRSLTNDTPSDTYGAHIAYGVSLAHLSLELEAGWLLETDQILGAYPQGAFGHEGTTPTLFAGIAGTYDIADDWEGRAHARMGRTTPNARDATQSGLHDITPLVSSAFGAGLYRRNAFTTGDALGFVVAQPLRIEEGEAELTYAVGRTRNKILLEETLAIPLAPSGRAVDMAFVYEGAHMIVSAGATLNARHEAGRTDAHVAVRLFGRF